ncbi:MAG TPA: isocitrate lyase/PEP mutase family protein [Burkholderiales bacterium]|jgi:2-methylisocitrate lyase-like PEP mutase family enzyme|nr:isocitrate lyase/PEP mutase family protein [Burkholderiales bacterium]
MESKGRQLRRLINAPEILVTPGVYDGYSARLVERMGFKSGSITGAGTSESRLGWADRGVMGLDENVANARRLADCTNLLLRADADTGYGNAMSVYFATRAFEKAGVAAVMFEDQVWPKRCGHMAGKSVIGSAEMVQKVKAAVDARVDADFIIIARTDAAGPIGVDEAIDRLNRYAEAGADCLYADALLSKADIAKVAKGVPKPLIVNMGLGMRPRKTTPLMTPKELEALGVAVVSYPRLLTTAAVRGMMNAMTVFKGEVMDKNRLVERDDLQVSFEEINDLMGMAELDKLEERYAGG